MHHLYSSLHLVEEEWVHIKYLEDSQLKIKRERQQFYMKFLFGFIVKLLVNTISANTTASKVKPCNREYKAIQVHSVPIHGYTIR